MLSEMLWGNLMYKILLVDDNKDHLRIFSKMLTSRGDDIYSYSDPFLALCAAIEYKPDLVIVDQSMPEMEGTQLITEMKKAGVTAKFILASGHHDLNKHPKIKRGIVDSYLKKPFQACDINQAIDSVFSLA